MDWLSIDNVRILERANDWRDAIYRSVEPLEEHGFVESRYKDEIIKNVEEFGPYIVIAPQIAMPHVRPEQGAVKTQIGVTLFGEEVFFDGKDTPARLFVTLAAQDSDSHMDALMKISELLSDEGMVEKILASKDVSTLYHYFAD
jgi:mannitol/fructose-specific phosphotransferase system IIA component (Ntr-type)